MANETKTIIIKNETKSAQSSEPERVSTGEEGNGKVTDASGLAVFAIGQTLGVFVSEVSSWTEYEINKNLTMNDDYIGQRNLQIATKMINTSVSSFSSVVSSALMGSTFGPIGTAVGTFFGIAKSVANIAHENIQMQEQQNIHIAQMDASLDFTRKRSGWSTTAASIGEDL